jgi:hypothetical protein
MTLSFNKLEKLLSEKGLLPKKYFTIHDLIIYVEVLSLSNAGCFLLYIPSKYEIEISGGDDVYKVKYVNVTEDGHIPEDYAGEPDVADLRKNYDCGGIDLVSNENQSDMQGYLEEKYKYPVSLKSAGNKDVVKLKEVFRQLRRLKFCTQTLNYKLAIVFNRHLCCIRRDDTYECFAIQGESLGEEKRLMVTIDLETLYEKIDTVSLDIKTIRDGVCKVLDKNQNKHVRNIQRMLEQKNKLIVFAGIVKEKKDKYSKALERLEKLLADLVVVEKKNMDKFIEAEEKFSRQTNLKGMNADIERSNQIYKFETEISRINSIKQELIRNILTARSKRENLALSADNIVFDNIVMIDAVIKNFEKLSNINAD